MAPRVDRVYVRLRDGLRLRVEVRGAGRPLLLLHGFTGCVEAWPDTVLEGLVADGFRPVIPDLPGHGRSDAPPDPSRYRLTALLDDLDELLDHLGVDSCPWVGYSMGGRVALGAAVLREGRISRLVLESASPGLATARERAARRRRDASLARRIEARGMERFVSYWMDLPLFASQRSLPDAVLADARQRRLDQRARGLAASLRGLGTGSQPPFWAALQSLAHPTLLITGRKDEKYDRLAARMADEIPDVRRIRVGEAGHTVHLEAPEAWLRGVKDFLS